MRILFVADVFGVPGRRAVEERLPTLREELAADFCVVNGENAADGAGITPRIADRILAAGTSKLGTLLDFSHAEEQALARYTQDAGNHVEIEVRPAAALSTP